MATVEKAGGAMLLSSIDERAARMGLTPGQTLSEARAQLPSLRVARADPEADAATLSAVARTADRYTPLVALAPPSGLFLDITGCAHLFGGEEAMVADLAARLTRRGLSSRITVADYPAIAWAMARHGAGGVVPPGAGLAAVGPLPVEALRLSGDVVAVLSRLGLKTVDQLLAQPRAALVQRFGHLLARRIDQIEGRESEPISPLSPVPPLLVERRFAEPVIEVEAIRAALSPLCERLATMLEGRGEGALRLCLRLFHANGAVREAAVGASRPLLDPRRMTSLLSPRLDGMAARIESESESGIDLIRLMAAETAQADARQDTFDGTEAARADLARLVDILSERLGAKAVQRLVPVDNHQPAAADGRVPARDALAPPIWPTTLTPAPPGAHGSPPFRPLRLLERPERVEALAGVPDGPPVRFVWRRVAHQVAAAEGPERIAPSWWEGETRGLTCDYFRVEDTEGRRFWMFRRGLYGEEARMPEWFVHGLFA